MGVFFLYCSDPNWLKNVQNLHDLFSLFVFFICSFFSPLEVRPHILKLSAIHLDFFLLLGIPPIQLWELRSGLSFEPWHLELKEKKKKEKEKGRLFYLIPVNGFCGKIPRKKGNMGVKDEHQENDITPETWNSWVKRISLR